MPLSLLLVVADNPWNSLACRQGGPAIVLAVASHAGGELAEKQRWI